jgi:hypothetical protein
MGFFDLFKSKETLALEANLEKMVQFLFPNGDTDITRDAKRIHILANGKLSYDECKENVIGCKGIIYIAENKSAERLVPSIMARLKKCNEKEAYSIYAYLSGESMYMDRINAMAGSNLITSELHQNGVDSDELTNGFGEYGLTKTNPIPTISADGSNDYLSRLRYNKQNISYVRTGSVTAPEITNAPIDVYAITYLNTNLVNIYICPYHRRNSKKVPKGFEFIDKF